MRVALVDNLVLPESGSFAELDLHPHLGLLAITAAAERNGHHVRIHDPKRRLKSGELAYDSDLYEAVAREIMLGDPAAVGFTTLGCSFIFAAGVAASLKRHHPDLPLLLGGPHATMLHREILERFSQFDVIVRHEADETFAAVLTELETRHFDGIPGISWRASDTMARLRFTDGKPKIDDLDTLPLTSYDHYPIRELDLDLLRIEAGRGCPFACTFCSTAGFFQRSFRLKSAQRLVHELDTLHERYGASNFKLDHDLFTVNRRKVIEFCEAVNGRGYRWRASARVDCVDEALLTTMAEAGCVALYFGVETGSERMQQISQKRLDLRLVEPILNVCAILGIETTASFITGYPEETESDQNDTLDMMGLCFRPGCLPQLHILAPEPGTPMFELRRQTIAYDGYGGPYNATLVDDEDLALVLNEPDVFSTYYYYPAQMPRRRYIFAVEAAHLMRRAGPVLVRYLLRSYQGRLSNAIADLRTYADQRPGYRPDADTLLAFISARFGRNHHLTSLFRYALCMTSREVTRTLKRRSRFRWDPQLIYELNADAEMLPDMHDCQLLVERIKRLGDSDGPLDDATAGDRALYVMVFSADGATSYRLDAGAEPLIRLFGQPRSCSDASIEMTAALEMDQLHEDFFEDIARVGIIVPVDEASASLAHSC